MVSFHIQNLSFFRSYPNFQYLRKSFPNEVENSKNFIIFSSDPGNSKKLFSAKRVTWRRLGSVMHSWKRWGITSEFRLRSFRNNNALFAARCHNSQRSRSVLISSILKLISKFVWESYRLPRLLSWKQLTGWNSNAY